MAFVDGPILVRTPATSANLGPGFDALGLALGLYDEVTAEVAGGDVRVEVTGEGTGELRTDARHLVAASALTAFERLGETPPGLRIRCRNSIPQARGLGSSSAAIVAGIMIARGLTRGGAETMPLDAALRLAGEIEGHPDNVAPCLLGGFTIAWHGSAGARAVSLRPAEGVQPVLFVPGERGLTAHARAALPAEVPHPDAARNAGRAALLVHALTAEPGLLLEATEDRLHQDYRASAMPATAALVRELREAGVAAVVSGAGPSVCALLPPGGSAPQVPGWTRLAPGCDLIGARIHRSP